MLFKRAAWCMAAVLALATGATTAWAAPGRERMVEVILDCSGSMKNRLPSGETRIEAAKKAVGVILPKLPEQTVLAFRAYGHQSPTAKHDCQDSQLIAPFAPAGQQVSQVVATAQALPAQGYTPITYVLGLAAQDFPSGDEADKAIILVSDGKETCQGDPCAKAKALHDSLRVVIHTVGLGVDQTTRAQLECVASAAGGRYFPAASADELAQMLLAAVETAETRTIKKKGFGHLKVKGADLGGHQVTNTETGEKVASLSHVQSTVKLPAGIYNVTVGKAVWRSVEVKADETTVLEPGILTVNRASYRGHQVKDPETGEAVGEVSNTRATIALMPGAYLVTFGQAIWPIKLEVGQRLALNPGLVTVEGAKITGHKIYDAQGQELGAVSATGNSMALPPGSYAIDIDGNREQFILTEGHSVKFRTK